MTVYWFLACVYPFGFKDGTWSFIVLVPVYCLFLICVLNRTASNKLTNNITSRDIGPASFSFTSYIIGWRSSCVSCITRNNTYSSSICCDRRSSEPISRLCRVVAVWSIYKIFTVAHHSSLFKGDIHVLVRLVLSYRVFYLSMQFIHESNLRYMQLFHTKYRL